MTFTAKRYALASLLALVAATMPVVLTATPAHASTYCEYFYGPTPSVEVDLNDDGNPEVRVPSLSNVSVCAETDVFADTNPVHVEPCAEWFEANCWRVYVHVEAGVHAYNGLTLCRSVDGSHSCSTVDVGPWDYRSPDMNRICIGIHTGGGSACSHGEIVGFVE